MFQFKTEVTETCNKYATEHGEQVQAVMNETAKNATDIMKISGRLASMETTLALHRGDIDSNKVATEANKAGMGVLEKRMETLETKLTSSSAGPVLTNTGMKEAHEKTIRTETKLIVETQQQIEASKIELLATQDSLTAKYEYSIKALYAAHTTELKKRQRIIENSESRINDENTTFRRNTVTFSQAEN